MHIDLIRLIGEACKTGDCQDKISEPLDPHAPIELHFDATPMIRVEVVEEDAVLLSCQLGHGPVVWSGELAMAMCDLMSRSVSWSASAGVSFVFLEDSPHMLACVSKPFLINGAAFSQAIDGFYEHVCAAVRILRR